VKLELEWCGKPEDDYRTFLPVRKTPLSSGVDLKAYNTKPITIKPGTNALISTGWKVKIPEGYEIYEHPLNAQVFLRKKQSQVITDIENHLITKVSELKYTNKLLINKERSALKGYNNG